MRKIPLRNFEEKIVAYTLVDDEDFKVLNRVRWHLSGKDIYAIGRWKIPLHIHLLHPPRGKIVDHKNGNSLDNRRKNLRLATPAQSVMNRGVQKNSVSGLKGVSLDHGKWRSRIGLGGVIINLGMFGSKFDAAKAYNKAAKKYFGEFARLNKIPRPSTSPLNP